MSLGGIVCCGSVAPHDLLAGNFSGEGDVLANGQSEYILCIRKTKSIPGYNQSKFSTISTSENIHCCVVRDGHFLYQLELLPVAWIEDRRTSCLDCNQE